MTRALILSIAIILLGVWLSFFVRSEAANEAPASDRPLPCIRKYESGGGTDERGNYLAHGTERRNGRTYHYWGAYQFSQSTWDSNAKAGPHTDWVGVRPDAAPADIQDSQARVSVQRRGLQPWPTPNRKCKR